MTLLDAVCLRPATCWHRHHPDRTDPRITWCDHCGACLDTPNPTTTKAER